MCSATVEDPRINSGIVNAYRQKTPGSADLFQQAQALLPSGIAHDARNLDPYGPYIQRAQGPHKWDVDGHKYIDYFGGHGALILGHGNPTVAAAIAEAAADGSQFGSSHPREIGWAKAIQRLIPSAERVRFTSSGTEATLMGVRLARAFTGRGTILRLKGHFHGWHDHMAAGYSNHFDGTPTPGVIQGIADKTVLVMPNDTAGVEEALRTNPDIAVVIFEPTGSSFGQLPLKDAFVHSLRELTTKYGALLMFDEVVTGFRTTKGGAQMKYGIKPDLSSFAKIVAGGMPGAAITGRKDILDLLDFKASAAKGQEKIGHPGTFNANPISAAAGIAALTIIAETPVNETADASCAALRDGLNKVLSDEGVRWAAYGTTSGFHMFVNPQNRAITPGKFDPFEASFDELKSPSAKVINRMRLAMLVNGVDLNPRLGGFTSCTHTATDVADTVAAFKESVRMMKAEGEL